MFRANKTREELCAERELPQQVLRCIEAHMAAHDASPFVASVPITDSTNPAFREDGSARMCAAARDLKEGSCIACFPGSGHQSQRLPAGAYEDAYSFDLEGDDGWRLIPTKENDNALSSLNDFRTNIDNPAGPQDRSPMVKGAEIWLDGGAFLVFYTLCDVKKGEELLWDYGADYWADKDGMEFRSQDLATQEKNWEAFLEMKNMKDFRALLFGEVGSLACIGSVWKGLMVFGHPESAAAFLCVGAMSYVRLLLKKRKARARMRG